MKRVNVEDKYKWDLTKIILNDADFKNKIEFVRRLSDDILSLKGKILSNESYLKEFLLKKQQLDLVLEKITVYAKLLYSSDSTKKESKEKLLISEKLLEDISSKLSFVKPEILNGQYKDIIKMINNIGLEDYSFYFEKLFREKNIILTEAEEKIITAANNTFGTGASTFNEIDNIDASFGKIEIDGKIVEITNSIYMRLMNYKDQKVREKVFKQYYNYYLKRKNTISECLKGQIKENFFNSNVRGFDSPLEFSLYDENIDKELYTNLISVCHDKSYLMHEYMKLRKDILGLNEMHMYDIYLDLIDVNKKRIKFDDCQSIIMGAMAPLGENYLKLLKKAFDEKWIDVFPNKGKYSGAFEESVYRVDPFISVNYEHNIDSIVALAHELGHAIHTYYSDNNNSFINSKYPMFLAEIASTINEILLSEYLINNAKNNKEKLFYITKFLDDVRLVVFRQTMLAEFEMIIHDKYRNGIPLTENEFSSTFYNLNKQLYGDSVISDKEIEIDWARIPHFYMPFYVYKYATGMISAMSLTNSILNGNSIDEYIKLLSSGGTDYPLNILKKCGVDITSKKELENSFDLFENRLEEAKSLSKFLKKY